MRAKVTRVAEHHFLFQVRGMEGSIDVPVDVKTSKGPSPKELALAALCGCTGTDVVDLLAKFQVSYESLELEARAELTDHHPKIFKQIDLSYKVTGAKGDLAMVAEAVKRSTHQYSGMAAMLSKACPIQYVVIVNGENMAQGEARF
jgi:putative redox protein